LNIKNLKSKNPKRMISLIPCVTETLFELGGESKIVGVTDYCIYPKDKVDIITKVGGPKSIDIDKINEIKPDLIFMDPEENVLDDFEVLRKNYDIFVVNAKDIDGSINFIKSISKLLNTEDLAEKYISGIKNKVKELDEKYSEVRKKRALVLLWKEPYFVPGGSTYINSVLETCGMVNVFEDRAGYFKIEEEELIESSPEIIFLPSEPYEFTNIEKAELENNFNSQGKKIKAVMISGEELCWYGVRTLTGLKYIEDNVTNLYK